MRKKRIIFIHDADLVYNNTVWDSVLFHKDDIKVECWSLLKWRKGVNAVPHSGDGETFGEPYYITDLGDFITNLERIKNDACFFVCYPYHGYDEIGFYVRKKIKKYGFEFANLTEAHAINIVPLWQVEYSYILIVFQIVKVLISLLMWWNRSNREYVKKQVIRFIGPYLVKAKKNFIITKVSYRYIPNVLERFSSRNILLHSPLYDVFLKQNVNHRIIQEKYIVYVDQGLINMSWADADENALPLVLSRDRFLNKLKKLFDCLEKDIGCKVIIAAHPKSMYKGGEFGDRKIIKGKSFELIKYAELVVIHFSTIFAAVALYGKRFLCVYDNEFFVNYPILKKAYNAIKQQFSCDVLDIDEFNSYSNFMKECSKSDYLKVVETNLVPKNAQFNDDKVMDTIARICRSYLW